ncbi:MAG: four helix bundle protein [Oscillospiraceae bacterium]|nr:four helix bundle protein [Oscillospiraceae bacterium]
MENYDNIVRQKSFSFSVRIVKLCRYLQIQKREFVLSRQLLRAGTSIGANVAESEHAQSRPDFSSKLNIALKEAAETDYWLRLLHQTEYLSDKEFHSIFNDCKEIENLLASIVKTMKQ